MNKDRIVWFGRYEGWLRMLARGVRDGDCECMAKAARLFDMMLPNRCVVVPMPSHYGVATAMRTVATELCKNSRRCLADPFRYFHDGLTCEPHESSYDQKKDGCFPSRPAMKWDASGIPPDNIMPREVWIIDNVICTGVTAASALDAVGEAWNPRVAALALSQWRAVS